MFNGLEKTTTSLTEIMTYMSHPDVSKALGEIKIKNMLKGFAVRYSKSSNYIGLHQ